jgi:hypothetical protein
LNAAHVAIVFDRCGCADVVSFKVDALCDGESADTRYDAAMMALLAGSRDPQR